MVVALVMVVALAVAGCGVGKQAVATGSSYTFVAPGGQTRIFYDPPTARGTVSGLSGESLLQPGTTISVADFPNQVLVLNIWGTWCGPCREEMPGLQQIYSQLGPQGVTVLGIDVRDERGAAGDFLRDRAITYPSIFDLPGRSLVALRGFPRNTVPSTIVLDRSHRVAAVYLTAVRVAELLPVVARVAAEAPSASPAPDATGGPVTGSAPRTTPGQGGTG